jgi:hypothetical protein
MIRPLRQRHHRMVIALGVFIPIAFTLGIVGRKSVPSMDSLPASLVAMPLKFEVTEWERADLFVKSPIKVRLLREQSKSGRVAVEFSAPTEFVKPDLMVYWVAGDPKLSDILPDAAQLLGAFSSSSALALPENLTMQNGALLLYSLADNEIVEVSKPFSILKP